MFRARRQRPAFDIGDGGFIRRDQAGARTAFDGHVTDRHAPFHRKRANGRADIFDHMAGAAGGADGADNGENHVLAGHTERQFAVDGDAHVLRPLLHQRLGGKHMLHLARADTEGKAAEGAVRRGVAVAAHQRNAGLGRALLGADDMDNTLAFVEERYQRHIEIGAVLEERFKLHPGKLILDAVGLTNGGNNVIRHGKKSVRPAQAPAAVAHAFKAGPARDLMGQVHVDIEKGRAVVVFGHDMAFPNLIEQGFRIAHLYIPRAGSG